MWEASWRNYELKKERDAAIARAEQAERERDELEARVRELEAALRARSSGSGTSGTGRSVADTRPSAPPSSKPERNEPDKS